jgi:hypothetical protein
MNVVASSFVFFVNALYCFICLQILIYFLLRIRFPTPWFITLMNLSLLRIFFWLNYINFLSFSYRTNWTMTSFFFAISRLFWNLIMNKSFVTKMKNDSLGWNFVSFLSKVPKNCEPNDNQLFCGTSSFYWTLFLAELWLAGFVI